MPEPDLARYARAALDGRISQADYYRLWRAVIAERGKALKATSANEDRRPSPTPVGEAPASDSSHSPPSPPSNP